MSNLLEFIATLLTSRKLLTQCLDKCYWRAFNQNGCLLHHKWISIIPFADDVALLALTSKGLLHHVDALPVLCTLTQLTVNLFKTKVMVFNTVKEAFSHLPFHFPGQEVEITTSYLYLGVLFNGPTFGMKLATQAPVKMNFFDALVKLMVAYGFEIWGPILGPIEWSCVKRIQSLFLWRFIQCKSMVPHFIILTEFGASPLRLKIILRITYLHRVHTMGNRPLGCRQYLYLVLHSLMELYLSPWGDRGVGIHRFLNF